MYNIRLQLLCDYLNELQKIKGLSPLSSEELNSVCSPYFDAKNTKWIDIYDGKHGKDIIGFLIIGFPPNCHPDTNFYIEEAYIKPQYRRQGYMSSVASKFIKDNPGSYCLFILNRNEAALQFWHKVFAQCGYVPCFLCDVGAGDAYCKQFGFKKVI